MTGTRKSRILSDKTRRRYHDRYSLDNDGLLRFRGRIYVPPNDELRVLILSEAHRAVYMAHPGVTKMRADLKPLFFWKGMKADIVNFVARCLECQQVKAEHRHPTGLLQPLAIPESKWDVISMELIVGLPLTARRHDSIVCSSKHSDEECSLYPRAYDVLGT
jgi:hypothetical protein